MEEVLFLLQSGCYLEEIRKKTGYSDGCIASIMNKLKEKGYVINHSIGDSGIKYYLSKYKNTKPFETYKHSENYLKTIFISDTHLGNANDRVDIIDKIFEYATMKGIKLIIHSGDFIEGVKYKRKKGLKFDDIEDMAMYAIKYYPRDKNITNFVLYGNHDEWSINEEGCDISKLVEEHRPDIISLGYTYGCINFNKDFLFIHHPIGMNRTSNYNEQILNYYSSLEPTLIVRGHAHISQLSNNPLLLYVPCLYDSYTNRNMGAWEANFIFKQDHIEEIELLPLVVEPTVKPVTEIIVKTLKK